MKLYTENQVKMMLVRAKLYRGAVYDNFAFIMPEDEVLNSETPIELPSNSICINCDESKSTHNICMDCIIKIGKENIELPTNEQQKQSSIEFLKIQFEKYYQWKRNPVFDKNCFDEIELMKSFKKAKEMHKEEHRNTYNQGLMSNFQNFDDYYKETFGGNNDTD